METWERIKALRLKRGMTQDQIERLTGIDQGHISLIENGRRRRVSADVMVRLARALGCSVEDLVARRQPVLGRLRRLKRRANVT